MDTRAIFLDRDGTLMDEVNFCRDPNDVRAIPGARELLTKARELGWKIIVITNQSGIGRGIISLPQYEAVHAELLRQLNQQVDGAYYCPDVPPNVTERRKPSPGMLREAAEEFGINLEASYMIGDKSIDVECGRRVGAKTILVRTGYGKTTDTAAADHITDDVTGALRLVLEL